MLGHKVVKNHRKLVKMAICNRLRDLQNEIVTPRKRTSCPAKLEFIVPIGATQKITCHSEPVRTLAWESPK